MNIKLSLKQKQDLRIIGVAVLYYLSARLGYFLAFEDTTALPTWPPAGVAFALTILFGRSVWPGITIGALVANIMAYWNDANLGAQTILGISSMIALGNTIEALAGNYIVQFWIKDRFPFSHAKNAFRFLFVTLMMVVIGAAIGTGSLLLNDVITADVFLQDFFTWWIGNAVGILLFTPFILALAKPVHIRLRPRKMLEVLLFAITIASIYALLQIDYLSTTLGRALPFLALPFLLWLAFRFELLVGIAGVLVASLVSIYFTIQGTSPFVLQYPHDSMLLLQIFIGVISISTIILSATVRERLNVQKQLEVFNENLEAMVEERTRALNDEINTRKTAEENLQHTNSELSKRNTELDNFVYSVSHDLRAPIASVLGLINLARHDKDNAMKDMYLDMINKSALQQDHFIREILDQSRNSRLDIKREEIFFEPLIEETFNQLKFATSTGKSVERIIRVNQDRPFFSDRWRLKVILNNIISNAIRYRNGKGPIIKVTVDIAADRATVSIEDNGKGIASEHLPHIYKMFYRATDDGAGSGLGLYIVKEAVDKLNGTISIQSEVGIGTTVLLDVPAIKEESFG